MKTVGLGRAVGSLAVLVSLGLGSALAQDADPPARAARLAYLSGEVSLQSPGDASAYAGQLNLTLSSGDRLWTGDGSRAEVSWDSAAVRMADDSDLTLVGIEDGLARLRVNAGTISVYVRRIDPTETLDIETPQGTLAVRRAGEYRIDVEPDGAATQITARAGAADVTGPGGSLQILDGEAVRIGNDDARPQVYTAQVPDAFDQWGEAREQRQARAPATRYVAANVVGYEDLDDYGYWESEPQYGHVWVPSAVSADWAPYTFGQWVWVEPWGWTWVDAAPWGYAPFHYGRWTYLRSHWCWVPGPRNVRPVYAPALVGWVGGAPPPRRGHSAPGVGWVPLGPREVYVPHYHASLEYVQQLNSSSGHGIDHGRVADRFAGRDRPEGSAVHYENRAAPGALATPSAQARWTPNLPPSAHARNTGPTDSAAPAGRAPPPAAAPYAPPRGPERQRAWNAPGNGADRGSAAAPPSQTPPPGWQHRRDAAPAVPRAGEAAGRGESPRPSLPPASPPLEQAPPPSPVPERRRAMDPFRDTPARRNEAPTYAPPPPPAAPPPASLQRPAMTPAPEGAVRRHEAPANVVPPSASAPAPSPIQRPAMRPPAEAPTYAAPRPAPPPAALPTPARVAPPLVPARVAEPPPPAARPTPPPPARAEEQHREERRADQR